MKASTALRWTGYLILSATTIVLFVLSFVETVMIAPVLSVAKAVVLFGLVIGLYREMQHDRSALPASEVATAAQPGRRAAVTGAVTDFTMVFGGAALTFLVSVEFALGAVVASGLIGLVGAALLKKHAVAIFCGSFVGMSSPNVFALFGWVLVAGAIAGLVFVLSRDVLNGFGGKLGTIAFAGAVSASFVVGCGLGSVAIPTGTDALWIVAYSVIAAVVTYALSVHLGNGPVVASALVGVVAGLLLPVVHGPDLGPILAVVAFCASFAGMSSPSRLPNLALVGVAGLFSGLVFLYACPHLDGAGGKLGTIAFGSTIAVWGLIGLRRPVAS
ncbi:MAG: hypothetical protein EA382_18495 [Spirochaetaceae bacterium]|nr:MAG: hypothetical protein EA382_18495 [Spirochaetaceae bacterium]